MADGIHIFDKSVQEANLWLKEIGQDMQTDPQRAYHALRATLHAVRDRVTVDEASHLGTQLPMLVKGLYYENWRPSEVPHKERSRDEFLQEIAAEIKVDGVDPEQAARSVFKCLSEHVKNGEIDEIRQALPEPVRQLWTH